MTARSDDYASHYNLGNFFLDSGKVAEAVSSYRISVQLRPDAAPIQVNLAMALYTQGDFDGATEALEKVLLLDPKNETAHLNLAMLLGEQGHQEGARTHFAQVLKLNPHSANAAFNLCVLMAATDWPKAEPICEQSLKIEPRNPKYAYTLAFYQHQAGSIADATKVLEAIIGHEPAHGGVYGLLLRIYEDQSNAVKAGKVCRKALANNKLSQNEKAQFAQRLVKNGLH